MAHNEITSEIVSNEMILQRKIGKTLYEISVKQSDNASESAEDILARLIATDTGFDNREVYTNG